MARPTSDVGICNMALDLIKEPAITIISTPVTQTEALCARWYDIVRQSVLSAYNWNFALLSAAISRAGTPSVSNYTDYYMLPNNYLRLRAIIDPSIPLSQREYEIQGNTLLYNNDEEDTLDIWYTKDETTVTVYPALFIKLLTEELALVLGKKLTARPSILQDIRTDREESRRLARAADGQMRPPRRYESSKIVNAGLNPAAFRTVAGAYEFTEGMED
jgi:hypothetical protein